MARIKTIVDPLLNLTEQQVAGDFSAREALETLAQFYDVSPTERLLWDVSSASIGSIAVEEFAQIADKVARYAKDHPGTRTAVVTSGELAYGLTRMYEAFRETRNIRTSFMSFRDRTDALAWLTAPPDLNEP